MPLTGRARVRKGGVKFRLGEGKREKLQGKGRSRRQILLRALLPGRSFSSMNDDPKTDPRYLTGRSTTFRAVLQ